MSRLRQGFLPGFPGGTAVQRLAANAGDASSTPGSERSPRGGNGNALRYSCLEKSMDRGAWQVTVHGVAGSDMDEHKHTFLVKGFKIKDITGGPLRSVYDCQIFLL